MSSVEENADQSIGASDPALNGSEDCSSDPEIESEAAPELSRNSLDAESPESESIEESALDSAHEDLTNHSSNNDGLDHIPECIDPAETSTVNATPEIAHASEESASQDSPPDAIPVPSDDDQNDAENQDVLSPSEKGGNFTPQEIQKGNNLIVNYVPRSFTDQTLYELFVPFGEIESARAILDRQTGQCQGYGFVKFNTKEAAANAIAHFQAAAPDTRQLKVHYARPSSTHKQCNIYISGLPIHFSEADTAALFEPFGPVVECKILIGKDGESRGCGFVRLCDVAKTHAAITALNETVPSGGSSRISVSLAAGTRKETINQQFPAAGAAPFRTAPYPPPPVQPYYSAQQPSYAHPYYQAAMSPYGEGRGAAQPPQQYGYFGAPGAQPYGRYPPGYGPTAGYAPVRHTPAGRPDVTPYGSGPVITPGPIAPVPPVAPNGGRQLYTGYCLFCFNLPMEYDETALRAIFSQYGNVSSSKVMRDPATGRSKGYGFVNMDTEQQAMAAIQALNGYPLNGKTLKVQFKTHGPVKPPTGTMLGQPPVPTYY